MASSYFKLKILRKKRSKINKINTEEKEEVTCSNVFDSNISYKNTCRICLHEGSITISSEISSDLKEYINLFGGIDLSDDEEDNFPKNLCNGCNSLLQNAILFRKKAQASSLLLKTKTLNDKFPLHSNDLWDKGGESNRNENFTNDDKSNKEKSKYSCGSCNTDFFNCNELVVHNNSKLHRSVRIQCPVCYRLFSAQLFEKHLASHHSTSHLICDVCGKLYRKDNLTRHLQLHTNDLPFQCKKCPYRGRFLESLKIHMRTHTGHKPFACEKCNSRFLTRSNLNRHFLTHSKQKSFKCIECARCFYTKHDMNVHFVSEHSGIKEFDCKICGNKYGLRKALMRHELRVHKRQKLAKGRMPLYLQAEYKVP